MADCFIGRSAPFHQHNQANHMHPLDIIQCPLEIRRAHQKSDLLK
jgi:hypothetical protein